MTTKRNRAKGKKPAQEERGATRPPEGHRAGTGERDARPKRSDLEEGVSALGRVAGGVATRLLGERITGIPVDREKPVISRTADRLIDDAGNTVGRLLAGAGEGMKAHPLSPVKALDEAAHKSREKVSTKPGEAPLAVGLRTFANGLLETTGAVIDAVAPVSRERKKEEKKEKDDDE